MAFFLSTLLLPVIVVGIDVVLVAECVGLPRVDTFWVLWAFWEGFEFTWAELRLWDLVAVWDSY